jgi:hypothetical protein
MTTRGLSTYFGDGFPYEHYFLLLRYGAITTQLYMGDSAQGSEDGYSAAFAEPLEALARTDRQRVQVAVQTYTGWWAPFVILAAATFPTHPTRALEATSTASGCDESNRSWDGRLKRLALGAAWSSQPRHAGSDAR